MDAKTLALYLGCEMRTYSGRGKLTSIDLDGHWYVNLNSGGGTVGNINDDYTPYPENTVGFPKGLPPKSILQPVLRPLSNMTEDEGLEVFGSEWDSDSPNARDVVNHVEPDEDLRLTPNETKTLLSKGFDLFGLIEKGEAIELPSGI